MAILRLALCAAALGGCMFSPDLGEGALTCGAAGECPPDYRCAADGRCHRGGVGGAGDGGVFDGGGSTDLAHPPGCATCDTGRSCGRRLDGCGHVLDCGACPGDQTCGAGGAPNVCGSGRCKPSQDCQNRCGLVSNGCDNLMSCSDC